jgi:hypothetical protein
MVVITPVHSRSRLGSSDDATPRRYWRRSYSATEEEGDEGFISNTPRQRSPSVVSPIHPWRKHLIRESDGMKLLRFLSLLRVDTTSGNLLGYRRIVNLLETYLTDAGCDEVKVYEAIQDKPVVVGTVYGKDESLGAVVFSGHYDVVPANNDEWSSGDAFHPRM